MDEKMGVVRHWGTKKGKRLLSPILLGPRFKDMFDGSREYCIEFGLGAINGYRIKISAFIAVCFELLMPDRKKCTSL